MLRPVGISSKRVHIGPNPVWMGPKPVGPQIELIRIVF